MKTVKLDLANYSPFIFNGIICLTLLLFFLNYFIDLEKEITVILAVLIVLTIIIFALRYKQLLLYCLSFVVPLSVPYAIGSSKISLPAELICVLLSTFFLLKLALGARMDKSLLRHPITLLILADLCWLFIASIFSQLPEVSFKRLIIRSCYYITFYYFYYELFRQNPGNIKKLFSIHVAGFLFPILYAVSVHASLGFTTVGSQQITAPFYFDHTIYGACLVFFIPFLLHYSFSPGTTREKVFYRSLLFIFTAATVLSYSRAAWLSLIVALAVGLILKYRIKFNYLLVLAGAALLFLVINQQRISSFVKDSKEISHSNDISMHFKSISNVNTDASNKERINRWKCALRMFADKPLTGFGPGTYQFFYGQYQQREDLTRISTFNGTKGHAHSEYLNYLSETGLVGCLLFILLIITVSIKSLEVIRKSPGKQQRDTALYVFTGLITFFIHAFFNGFLEFDKVAMPVFCSYAAISCLNLQMKDQNPSYLNPSAT